jgi:hypothetical protein
MTPAAFKRTLSNRVPPKGLSPPLQALWWAANGDWNRAHALVNNAEGRNEIDHSQVGQARLAWVHAHLHRVEGDLMNARYWYAEAGRALAKNSFEAERDEIARALLGDK